MTDAGAPAPPPTRVPSRVRTIPVIPTLALACAALAGCGDETRPDRDDHDTPRIAALAPSVASTLVDLGLEDLVVARHGYDLALDPALPVAGDQSGLDYEALARARPSVVLLDWGARALPDRLTHLLDTWGGEVVRVPMTTLDDMRAAFADLADRFGVRDILTPALDDALAPDPARARAGRVLLLMNTDPPEALGPGAHHHETLVALGGLPALAEDDGPWVRLDAEDLVRLAPDAIVLIRPRAPRADTAQATPDWGLVARLDLPGVRAARLAVIDDPDALLPGSPAIRFARALGERLDAWGDADPALSPPPRAN